MQKQKTEKISIFSSLDVKLKFLMNRVELTQFSVESSHVKLKIWAIQLKSSWKCEQLDFESSRIQNVNSKLDSTISLQTYLNDILIYSKILKKHRTHVKEVLNKFREVDLQINIDKCEFKI